MLKSKFEIARELIQDKRYEEARTLLRTIDHPKAAEWLAKLDKIAPASGNKLSNKSKSSKLAILAAAITIPILGLILAIVLLLQNTANKTQNTAQLEAVTIYCMNDNDMSREECGFFAETLLNNPAFAPIIANCTDLYAGQLDTFKVCMRDIEDELERLYANRLAVFSVLYAVCAEDYSLWGNSNSDDCEDWANSVLLLYPRVFTDACWTDNDYFGEIFDAPDEEFFRSKFQCIMSFTDENVPVMPAN